jgi:hypothetical protein
MVSNTQVSRTCDYKEWWELLQAADLPATGSKTIQEWWLHTARKAYSSAVSKGPFANDNQMERLRTKRLARSEPQHVVKWSSTARSFER